MRALRGSMRKACLLVGGLLLMSCGGSSSSTSGSTNRPSGGTGGQGSGVVGGALGGSVGTSGGTGGTGGSGATSSTRPECQVPDCFKALQNPGPDCTPMGACVQQTAEPNVNICWANGVKENVTVALDPSGNATATAVVKSPTGATCFSLDFIIDTASRSVSGITFHDATGKTIGTINGNPDGSVTATCPGQPAKTLPASCAMDMGAMMPGGAMPGAVMCTEGTCM